MKIPLGLLAAFCMLISSCQKEKEGPFGFKVGQKYETMYMITDGNLKGPANDIWIVLDVGSDWIEVEIQSSYNKVKLTKKRLESFMPNLKQL